MIGPVGTPGVGHVKSVRLRPSGVEVPPEPRAKPPGDPELAAKAPPVDAARVATIKVAIAEGRYLVDPAAVATAMIDKDLA